MKNLFKFGFLAFALTLGFASCGSESKTSEAVENATEAVSDAVDSVAAGAVDSAASMMADSAAKH